MDTRQNSRVGEHLSTDGTLRHVIQFFLSRQLSSHVAAVQEVSLYKAYTGRPTVKTRSTKKRWKFHEK